MRIYVNLGRTHPFLCSRMIFISKTPSNSSNTVAILRVSPFLRSEQVKHKEIYFYSVPEQFPVGGNCDYSPPPRETKISYTDTGDRIIRLFEPLIIRSF